MIKPRLRDSKNRKSHELFSLNEIPDEIVTKIGEHLIYLLSVGRTDISGDDWGDALAAAIGGTHLASPLGIADVVSNGIAWSTKTVKKTNIFKTSTISLISGRCSPDYSYGISDPHIDVQKTGTAVLGIWNERMSIAQDNYASVRTSVLVRSEDLLSYVLFEEENHRFRTADYEWRTNKNGNLKGYLKGSEKHLFTWQPHGSQFTMHVEIPESARKFTIKQPPVLQKISTLKSIGYDPSWITIIP